MPTLSHVDPRPVLQDLASTDFFGHDRLVRAFLRSIVRLRPGSAVAVHGAPGSGKNQFLLRCAYVLDAERESLGLGESVADTWCWYNPWLYQKHGNILSGLVATMTHHTQDRSALDRARDIVGHINRMHFGEDMPETAGTGIQRGDLNPIARVREGFANLVELIAKPSGRVLVFIEDMDMLSPSARLLLFEGLRLLATPESDVTFVLSVGRESALESMRVREPGITDDSAAHCLAELLDLSITVPGMDVRRIAQVLRGHIGDEELIKRAFGSNALEALSSACAARPLGMPRFLERLAGRITLLAEFAVDTRSSRELSEAQWAWVIVSERWPAFRRFMLRGGRDRWGHLCKAVTGLGSGAKSDSDPTMARWIEKDLIFAEYLRLYAPAFEREADAVYWLETLQLACGL